MRKIKNQNFPYLLQVSVLIAVAITFLNDHYLKYQFPGFITGKLSDFSGIYYVPFFIYGLFSFLISPLSRHQFIRKHYFLACLGMVDILFVILKVTDVRPLFVDLFSRYFFTIKVVHDPTDLFALSMSAFSYLAAKRFFYGVSVKEAVQA